MNVTSISLAYFFLGFFIISLAFSLYFKVLVIRTNPGNKHRDNIIGAMKDPISWRNRNNKLSYISVFWSVASLAIFIYLKFFKSSGLVNMIFIFSYIAIAAISIIFFGNLKKSGKQK